MWERIKFWMRDRKDCAGCCLGCSYYEECRKDIILEIDEQEAYERDLTHEEIVDEIIKQKQYDCIVTRYIHFACYCGLLKYSDSLQF